jgi:hypothetical protein
MIKKPHFASINAQKTAENPLKTPSNAVLILCSSRVKTCQRAISAANGPISALNDAFSTGKVRFLYIFFIFLWRF